MSVIFGYSGSRNATVRPSAGRIDRLVTVE